MSFIMTSMRNKFLMVVGLSTLVMAIVIILGFVGITSSMANAQIAAAAEEQGAVSQEINNNVSVIRDLANQVAGMAEQTQQSSSELSNLSAELKQSTESFKV